jgi:Arc/MetJ-type ribon-helix-helix transcriptional regulator
MGVAKKITVHIPQDLLSKAQESTGQGITETIRRGLQLVAASEAYEQLRKLRGKVKVSVSSRRLREDRS